MAASIILQKGREKSLKRRHPWVFEGAIATIRGRCRPGDTVDVISANGEWLGRGAFSPESQIRVRIWSFNPQESIDNTFFSRRLETALRLRYTLMQQAQTNACRLIAAESDGLPGVTIDLYNQVAVLQLLSAGAERHREKIVWALRKLLPDVVIFERSDVEVRKKEGLEPIVQLLHGELPDEIEIHEHGVKIIVNPSTGHKTGFYLDQRENRLTASRYANNASVLNCFSYTGTFACYALKGGAKHVTNVDVSQPALDLAKRHIALNGFAAESCSQVKGDVFNVLRSYHESKQQFDMVILDPPKFVDSKASLKRASRGYKDINLYGIHAVKPGGTLLTFSCSGLMPQSLFQKIVADAALDAGREVKAIEHLSQAPDHPIGLNYPEGDYLKGLVCHVV